MNPFMVFLSIIVIQRIIELYIAKRNEKWMKAQGALEFGQAHYRWMVLMHVMFLFVYLVEVLLFNKSLSIAWPFLLLMFIVAQAGRIWILSALGRFWNTKIIVLPNAKLVRSGPYRYVKHPNYAIVIIELLVIPLLFNAYLTALIFTILNLGILSIRIPAEERALAQLTNYETSFLHLNHNLPKNVK